MILTNITKGVEYKLTMQSSVAFSANTSYQIPPKNQTDLDNAASKLISKDDGAFGALTNSPVYVAPGTWTITLTATEMNADKIVVVFGMNSTEKFCGMATIFTGSASGGGASAEEVAEAVWGSADALALSTELTDDGVLTGNGTVGDVLKALFYFLKKNRNRKTITR